MNKLLSFFIPKILKNFTIYYVMALVSITIVHFLPLNEATVRVIQGVIYLFIFPLYTYFTKSAYLPYSLDWILLTPTGKAGIIFAHGILNITKIFFIIFYMSLPFIILSPRVFKDLGANSLNVLQNSMTAVGAISNLFLLVFLLLLIFGILPSFHTELSKQRIYQVKGFKKNKSAYLQQVYLMLLGLITAGVFISDDIPIFIRHSIILSSLVVGGIYLTLWSVKYSFKKKSAVIATLIMSFSLSMLLYLQAKKDVMDPSLRFEVRLESMMFLGEMAGNSSDEILNQLKKAGPETSTLMAENINFLFDAPYRDSIPGLTQTLKELCLSRKDHSCRLQALIDRKSPKEYPRLDVLKMGCPNDLRSCFWLYQQSGASAEEKGMAWQTLEINCENPSYVDRSNLCEDFKRFKKIKASAN